MKKLMFPLVALLATSCASNVNTYNSQPVRGVPDVGWRPLGCHRPVEARQRPYYARELVLAGVEGWVHIGYDILESGHVANVYVIDSSPKGAFEKATLDAASKWKFGIEGKNAGERVVGCKAVLDFKVSDVEGGSSEKVDEKAELDNLVKSLSSSGSQDPELHNMIVDVAKEKGRIVASIPAGEKVLLNKDEYDRLMAANRLLNEGMYKDASDSLRDFLKADIKEGVRDAVLYNLAYLSFIRLDNAGAESYGRMIGNSKYLSKESKWNVQMSLLIALYRQGKFAEAKELAIHLKKNGQSS